MPGNSKRHVAAVGLGEPLSQPNSSTKQTAPPLALRGPRLTVSYRVLAVLPQRSIAHCHAFLTLDHYKSTVVAWCGIGGLSGLLRPTEPRSFCFGFETNVVDADVLCHLTFWRDGLGVQPTAVLLFSGRHAAAVSRCHQPLSIYASGRLPLRAGTDPVFFVACAGW